jgi:hypothetical protein
VDHLLIEVHDYQGESDVSSNAARQRQLRTRVRHYAQPQPEPVYLAVHRYEESVYYKRLEIESYRMLQSLASGAPIKQAIVDAFKKSSMRKRDHVPAIEKWFAEWGALGWFYKHV